MLLLVTKYGQPSKWVTAFKPPFYQFKCRLNQTFKLTEMSIDFFYIMQTIFNWFSTYLADDT